MTTVVSRLYDKVDTATGVADQLRRDGFPDATIAVVTRADLAAMMAAGVPARTAENYARMMQAGQAVFVCRAPFTPFGAARRAMAVADGAAALAADNSYIKQDPKLEQHLNSVLPSHPKVMTRDDYVGSGWAEWRATHVLGWPTVTRRREAPNNLITTGRPMSQMFWPGKLLSDKPRTSRVMSGRRHILTSARSVTAHASGRRAILSGHPRITELLGWPTLSKRA
ncbi:hypothetical protein LSUCC0031_09365 [Rhodobacterales bacterium LSUCC0031]|nr:hypothetical protein [Rhodobacterales bacterium LSUCC0031]